MTRSASPSPLRLPRPASASQAPIGRPTSSEEIRTQIERTRARMERTVDELERRLSPEALRAEAIVMARRAGGYCGRRALDLVREHPLPAAIIGVGLGLLVFSIVRRREPSNGELRQRYEPESRLAARADRQELNPQKGSMRQ